MRFYKSYINVSKREHYGATSIVPDSVFQRMLETEIKHQYLMETYSESLKGHNMAQTVLSFDQNSQKNPKRSKQFSPEKRM